MSRSFALAVLCLALGATVVPTRAKADFSACESAMRSSSGLDEKIRLYTICITKGALSFKDRAGALNNRGALYVAKGDRDAALADFNRAVELDPEWGASFLNRGLMHLTRHELVEAEADFTAVTQRVPSQLWPTAYVWRAHVHVARGDFPDALADFDLAIRQDPKNPAGLNGKAWFLATCPDAQYRNGAMAIDLAKRALARSDSAAVRDTLAAAYAEAGQFDEAVAEEQRAIEIERKSSATPGAQYESHLAVYKDRHPYRDIAP